MIHPVDVIVITTYIESPSYIFGMKENILERLWKNCPTTPFTSHWNYSVEFSIRHLLVGITKFISTRIDKLSAIHNFTRQIKKERDKYVIKCVAATVIAVNLTCEQINICF